MASLVGILIMCKHIWVAKQPMAFGASLLCDRCGAQLNRVWDVNRFSEEEADSLDIVEDAVMEVVDTQLAPVDYPF